MRMIPVETRPGYGPAGCLHAFDNENGSGEYWAYFRDNLFAVNAFDMTFRRAGTMRYRHPEHLSIGCYETRASVVEQGRGVVPDGTVSVYLAEEDAWYIAHYGVGSTTRGTSITMSPDYYRDYLQARFGKLPDVRRAFELVDGSRDFPELMALFKQARAYRGVGMAAELFYEGVVAEAMALVMQRAADLEQAGGRPVVSAIDRVALERVVRHIDSHLGSDLSCAALARCACMGQTKFKRVFNEVMGTPPASYVHKARMERAAELIRATDMTMAQVAHEVGYRKPGAFSAAFRRHAGVLPSEMR